MVYRDVQSASRHSCCTTECACASAQLVSCWTDRAERAFHVTIRVPHAWGRVNTSVSRAVTSMLSSRDPRANSTAASAGTVPAGLPRVKGATLRVRRVPALVRWPVALASTGAFCTPLSVSLNVTRTSTATMANVICVVVHVRLARAHLLTNA